MSEFNPLALTRRLQKVGDDYADKRAAYEHLERVKDAELSRLKHIWTDESDAKATTLAKGSDEWREFLNKLNEANKEYLKARVKWEVANAHIEMLRTEQSNQRQLVSKGVL